MSETAQVEAALADHKAFERDEEAFVVRTTAVDGRVRVEERDAGVVLAVRASVPTIDAVVADETVAPVVQEGWFETFERRLEDVGGVTRGAPEPPTATLEESEVVVETDLVADQPQRAVDDAKAIVEYVEGTFVEGLIPGYSYREPAAGLLSRARSAGER